MRGWPAAVDASFWRKRYELALPAKQQQASHASQKQQQRTAAFTGVGTLIPYLMIEVSKNVHTNQDPSGSTADVSGVSDTILVIAGVTLVNRNSKVNQTYTQDHHAVNKTNTDT